MTAGQENPPPTPLQEQLVAALRKIGQMSVELQRLQQVEGSAQKLKAQLAEADQKLTEYEDTIYDYEEKLERAGHENASQELETQVQALTTLVEEYKTQLQREQAKVDELTALLEERQQKVDELSGLVQTSLRERDVTHKHASDMISTGLAKLAQLEKFFESELIEKDDAITQLQVDLAQQRTQFEEQLETQGRRQRKLEEEIAGLKEQLAHEAAIQSAAQQERLEQELSEMEQTLDESKQAKQRLQTALDQARNVLADKDLGLAALRNELKKAGQELQVLSADFQSKVAVVEADRDALQDKIVQLEDELETRPEAGELDLAVEERRKAEAQIVDLKRTLEAKARELERVQEAAGLSRKQLGERDQAQASLRQQMEQARAQNAALEKERLGLQEKQALHQKEATLKDQSVSEERHKLEAKVDELTQALELKKRDLQRLEAAAGVTRRVLTERDQTLAALHEQLEAARAEAQGIREDFEVQRRQLEQRAAELEKELHMRPQEMVTSLNEELEFSKRDVQRLQAESEVTHRTLAEREAEVEQRRQELRQTRGRMEDLATSAAAFERKAANLAIELEEARRTTALKDETIERVEASLGSLQLETEQRLESLQTQIRNQQQTIESFEAKKGSLSETEIVRLAQAADEKRQLEEKLTQVQAALHQAVARAEERAVRQTELQAAADKAHVELEAMRKAHAETVAGSETLRARAETLERELQQRQTAAQQLEGLLQGTKSDYEERLHRLQNQLTQERELLAQLQAQVGHRNDVIAKLESDLERAQSNLDTLRRDREQAATTSGDLEARVAQRDQGIRSLEELLLRTKSDYETEIARLREQSDRKLTEMSERLAERQTAFSNLEATMERARVEQESLRQFRSQAAAQADELRARCDTLTHELRSRDDAVKSLEDLRDRARADLEDQVRQLQKDLAGERDETATRARDQAARLTETLAALEQARQDLDTLRQARAQAETTSEDLRRRMQHFERQAQQREETLRALEGEIARTRTEAEERLVSLRKELQERQAEQARQVARLDQEGSHRADLEAVRVQRDGLEAEKKELEARVGALNESLQRLTKTTDELKATLRTQEAEIAEQKLLAEKRYQDGVESQQKLIEELQAAVTGKRDEIAAPPVRRDREEFQQRVQQLMQQFQGVPPDKSTPVPHQAGDGKASGERRRGPRFGTQGFEFTLSKTGFLANKKNLAKDLRDISETGMRAILAENLEPGTKVRFRIEVKKFGDVLEGDAEIRWVRLVPNEPSYECGVEYTKVDTATRVRIKYLMGYFASETARAH